MELAELLAVLVPAAAITLLLCGGSLLVLKLAERSLHRVGFGPPGFPLARKLFPAAVALILAGGARWLAATSVLERGRFFEIPLSVVTIWSAVYLLLRMVWVLSQLVLHRLRLGSGENVRSRRVRTQLQFLEKLMYVTLIFLGACSSLLLFEGARRFGESLLASAGIAGVVVGLAAQKSLGNLIAGFQIAFTQPLRIEDVVVVEGEWGWVEEITLTYVVVRIWDRRRLVLPITYFLEKPFQNWTRSSAQIIGEVTLEVAHQVPFGEVERELFRLLDETPMWDRDVRVLQMVAVAEHSVTLRALMTARDSPTCWDLRCFVRRGLVEFLDNRLPEALPAVRIDRRSAPAGGETSVNETTAVLAAREAVR